MVSQITDASTVMGPEVNTGGIQELSAGEYSRAVTERLARDYVRMYHPDGTSSVVQLPPLGKNGKGRGDRQAKILHYITNKLVRGKQWWYASPDAVPGGWKPKTPRYSCFLVGCDRNREPNLYSLFDLFQHFNHKHPDETKMYEGVLKAIQQKLSAEIPPELAEQLGLTPGTTSLDETQFSQVMMGGHLAPEQMAELVAEDASAELAEYLVCPDCDYTTEGKVRHDSAMRLHRQAKHEGAT